MAKNIKCLLAYFLIAGIMMTFAVPVAKGEAPEQVIYNFNLASDYNKIPADPETGKANPFSHTLTGNLGDSKVQKSIPERYSEGELNWTYEAVAEGSNGITAQTDHLPRGRYFRMVKQGLRCTMGEGQWIALRIKSPGTGVYTMDLNFTYYEGAPTVAVYVLDAEGEASIDRNTVLDRQESIHTAMDPSNRVGKADLNVGQEGTNTAFIGNWTFEGEKEYIVVFEIYREAMLSGNYICPLSLVLTPGQTQGTELRGAPEVNSVQVMNNVVPASDGGYMGAVWEVQGHDYFFLPIEGGKMVIYDLDKFAAGEDALIKTVTTGLVYPTHATVSNDGRVIVGGDGKRMYIFDTNTMSGYTTHDIRVTPGLENSGHNQGSFYNPDDGLIYFGTLYDGHIARYNMETRQYEDMGDMVSRPVQEMVFGTLTEEEADNSGAVRCVACCNGFAYGVVNSSRYSLVVKYDLSSREVVAAIDVWETMGRVESTQRMTFLGERYLIISSDVGLTLIDLTDFTLVKFEDVVEKGLFDSFTDTGAQEAWENGMLGQATEEINGKQYFFINNTGMYSYEVATGKMAFVSKSLGNLRTGQKTTVTLKLPGDSTERTYIFTYANGGQPRLYDPETGKKISLNYKLEIDMDYAGGSAINIGTSYDDVLYIGAWNNWNCAAFDTETETVVSRYVTGGQTDSQTHYVDEEGNFHLISGNYSCCVVYEIDPLNKTGYGGDPDSNIIKPLISNMIKYDQKRIHTVTAGDGYVFAGTIPTSYTYGGGVGVYNSATGTEDFIHFKQNATAGEKCVPEEFSELWDLSVKGIAYYDGRLYGATARAGGSGSEMVAGTSAQIFVMDYKNMQIEATLDLREYLTLVDADGDGKEDLINSVGGISVDEQGRIWGICANVLFCFTYDKDTRTFNVQEVLNLDHSDYKSGGGVSTKNRAVIFDPDHNCVFVSFYDFGIQQIMLQDWNAPVGSITVTENVKISNETPKTYVLGANNNLYYESDTSLYMIPVNVEESDWAAASALDVQIRELGNITADKVAAVAAVREAYDALSLRDQALVQEIRTLLEAEAMVLEIQIAEAVAIQKMEELPDLMLRYEGLGDSQKRYVQNYGLLVEAYEKSLDINSNPEALAVQAQINELTVSSRRDEEAVVAAREAYEALPSYQQKLVNIANLLAAEQMLDSIRNTAKKQYTYDFKLYENDAFMNGRISNSTQVIGTAFQNADGTVRDHNLYSAKIVVNEKNTSVYNWFFKAYSDTINWGPEACNGKVADVNPFKDIFVTAATKEGLKISLGETGSGWVALRIYVPQAGNYRMELSCFSGVPAMNVYILTTDTDYSSNLNRETVDTIPAMLTEDTLVAKIGSAENTDTVLEQWNCETPGDYILVLRQTDTKTKNLYLDTLVLTETAEVSADTAIAKVGDRYFANLQQAFAYQIESGIQAVQLTCNIWERDLVFPTGAVLDLNGYTLTADSVLTYAGNDLIDSSAGSTGVLKILEADGNMLSQDNARLPIYDAAAGGYRFFEISVTSAAVTGKGGADPKYWFRVEAENFDEVYKLIKAGSQLNITVKMTWNGGEADAVAGAEFLNTWAEKYAAGDSLYITVSAVNTEGLENFSLTPAIAANGVELCGSKM